MHNIFDYIYSKDSNLLTYISRNSIVIQSIKYFKVLSNKNDGNIGKIVILRLIYVKMNKIKKIIIGSHIM